MTATEWLYNNLKSHFEHGNIIFYKHLNKNYDFSSNICRKYLYIYSIRQY
jgi:hypothetical protein